VYSGEGQVLSDDGQRAEALSVVTREQCERILRFAYELARAQGRRKVTVAHKANIMKTTSGLFLKTARESAAQYDDIVTDEIIVDACAMKLVMYPEACAGMISTNQFGDIA